jgi:hypothetical protein
MSTENAIRHPHVFEKLFSLLEVRVHKDISTRIKQNPFATPLEYSLGRYEEGLQLQVRQAVITLHSKGYEITRWGFDPGNREFQTISGPFRIASKAAKEKLKEMDVRIDEYTSLEGDRSTEIFFRAENPDIDEITNRWNEIAAVIPDTGNGSAFCINPDADSFRKKHQEASKDTHPLAS